MRDYLLEEVLSKVVELYGDVRKLKTEMATKQEVVKLEKKLDHVTMQVASNTELSFTSKPKHEQLDYPPGLYSKELTIVSK